MSKVELSYDIYLGFVSKVGGLLLARYNDESARAASMVEGNAYDCYRKLGQHGYDLILTGVRRKPSPTDDNRTYSQVGCLLHTQGRTLKAVVDLAEQLGLAQAYLDIDPERKKEETKIKLEDMYPTE